MYNVPFDKHRSTNANYKMNDNRLINQHSQSHLSFDSSRLSIISRIIRILEIQNFIEN